MATPYFQIRADRVTSTQDMARAEIDVLPVLVIASGQSAGRGRSGAEWVTADRALAASLAHRLPGEVERPLSLMAGVAATRAMDGVSLKWPNDVMREGEKIGGILVERSRDVTVIGMGLNLWWPAAPEGMGAVFGEDPGPDSYAEIGGLWCAELMGMIESDGWPIDVYREVCETLGREITWEPDGAGRAVDVAPDGALIVDTPERRDRIYSGEVRHVRSGTGNLR